MANFHECTSCTGGKYDGANLKCHICLKPAFIECLVHAKVMEVLELVSVLAKSQPMSTPTRLQTRISKILNDNSQLIYICANCKQKRSLIEIIEDEKNKIKNILTDKNEVLKIDLANINVELLNEKNNTEMKDSEINRLKKENNELLEEIKGMNLQINEMSAFINTIQQENEQMKILGQDRNMEIDLTDNNIQEQAITQIKMAIRNEMAIMSDDIEARIKLECEKMREEINRKIDSGENDAKRKKTSDINREIITENIINGDTYITNTKNTKDSNKNNKNMEKIISILKPPNRLNENEKYEKNGEKDIYELHVSKFHTEQTENDIATYITEKTGISKNLFKITKLKSKKEIKKEQYNSFKITTLQLKIFNELIDQSIWGEFTVREYLPTITINRAKGQIFGNKYENNYENRFKTNRTIMKHDLRRNILERDIAEGEKWKMNKFGETPRRINKNIRPGIYRDLTPIQTPIQTQRQQKPNYRKYEIIQNNKYGQDRYQMQKQQQTEYNYNYNKKQYEPNFLKMQREWPVRTIQRNYRK